MNNISAAAAAVPVSVHGFTWTAFFTLAVCIINGTAVGVWLKNRPAMRKLDKEADEKLRDDLIHRVEKLEQTLDTERARHAAERAVDRHKLNNIAQCFDAVILLLEAAPERASEIVVKIKAMRADQMLAEATEKAAIHAAQIQMSAAADKGDAA